MRLTSFRTRVLVLAIAFSVLLIGSVLITAYFVVSGGMSRVAEDTVLSLSRQAVKLARDKVVSVQKTSLAEIPEVDAASQRRRLTRAQNLFQAALPELFRTGMSEGEFAFYAPADLSTPEWSTDRRVDTRNEAAAREKALRLMASNVTVRGSGSGISGLFSRAQLGLYTVHVPIDVPDGSRWVLDVTYVPFREEQTIDAIRAPMLVLALVGTALAIAMMQMSMGWVLKLVDDLRLAADSVDAGQLDVHLPDEGQHEIGDLARSLNHLIDRLRRRADSQTRFIADASHELATPVAGIRGYVNILRAWGGEDEAVREEAVRAIDRESRRMARLTTELLSLIRSDHDTSCRRVRVDVNALSREALAAAATRYLDKGLEFEGPEEGPLIAMNDPDKIEEFMHILVDNAAKYTPSGGTVRVQTWRRRDMVVVEVSDTGMGIPEKDLPNIFDRFYRSDISRSKETGGFGLGLAIAKRMVEVCGGTIEVRSVEGEGTSFTIRIPRETS
ncbi:MAG TPA: HAMP domain-containing sensor histidine kinase [Coriobacteriia bacterium]|jgi:signal transduction histidine kinase